MVVGFGGCECEMGWGGGSSVWEGGEWTVWVELIRRILYISVRISTDKWRNMADPFFEVEIGGLTV